MPLIIGPTVARAAELSGVLVYHELEYSHTMSEPQHDLNVDRLEVVDGRRREQIEGWVPELASEAELRDALEKAFDYRGDVTITRKDGSRVEGYIFDRRSGATLAESVVRIIPQDSRE